MSRSVHLQALAHGMKDRVTATTVRQVTRWGDPLLWLRELTPIAASLTEPRMLFRTTDIGGVARSVYQRSEFDWPEMAWALDRLGSPQKGRAVVDVGANIGTTTISLLDRCQAAHVYAFEPAPLNFKLLRCNLILSGLEDRATVRPVAISDRSGHVTLEFNPSNEGDHRVRVSNNLHGAWGEAAWDTATVQALRLDEALDDECDVGLVWVDTQGHEAHVLAGATRFLQRRIPWVIEYWPYGLARSGGMGLLGDLIRANFSWIVDVRRAMRGEAGAEGAPDLITGVPRDVNDPADFTDLLLIP